MKKIVLLLLAALVMTACIKRNNNGEIIVDQQKSATGPYIEVIDSCEYIKWSYGMAHKGNCRFCEERKQKEFERLLQRLKEE